MLTSLDQLKSVTLVPTLAGNPPQAQAPALPPAQVPVMSAGKDFDRVLIIAPENQNYGSAGKAQAARPGRLIEGKGRPK